MVWQLRVLICNRLFEEEGFLANVVTPRHVNKDDAVGVTLGYVMCLWVPFDE